MILWQIREPEEDANAEGHACADAGQDAHARRDASADAAAANAGLRGKGSITISIMLQEPRSKTAGQDFPLICQLLFIISSSTYPAPRT